MFYRGNKFQLKYAQKVLDEMATRTKYLNFEIFQVWVIIILDKGSKYFLLGPRVLF
jgi:hypothetical protein